ncbi:MAG: hypothetical protein CL940_11065 [Deltaproteobacteria bacterium]|nr:hypothetical protein [Deltaproteobacteria bacterium]
MTGTLLTSAAVCLGVATALHFSGLLRAHARRSAAGRVLTALSVGLLIVAGVFELSNESPMLPMGPQVLLLVSLGVTLVIGAVGRTRSSAVVGPVVSSLLMAVAFALAVKALRGDLPTSESAELGTITVVHIGSTLLGFLLFIPAFVLAVLFLHQQERIKRKLLGGGVGSLLGLERQAWRLLACGFPLYSIGILLGFVWQESQGSDAVRPEHVLSALSWCVYAMITYRHFRSGWRGKPAAVANMAAFCCTLGSVLLYVMR